MSKNQIFNNRFFQFCGEKEFAHKKFIKHLYAQKQAGLKNVVEEGGLIKQHSYFDETQTLLKDLIHGVKYYSDPEYKKNATKERRYYSKTWSARDGATVFKKYPYLNDKSFLEELRELVCEERAIQRVIESGWYKPGKGHTISHQDGDHLLKYLEEILPENYKSVTIRKYAGYFGVGKGNNVDFLIQNSVAVRFKKMNVFKVENSHNTLAGVSYDRFSLEPNFREELANYKKFSIKEKMTNAFNSQGMSNHE